MIKLDTKEQGYILIGTVMFIMILAIVSLAFMSLVSYQDQSLLEDVAWYQADLNAESGLFFSLSQTRAIEDPEAAPYKVNYVTIQFDDNPFGSGKTYRRYSNKPTIQQGGSGQGSSEANLWWDINSVGQYYPFSYKENGWGPVERRLGIKYNPATLGIYFYFTDKETSPPWENPANDIVRFWYYDKIRGPLFTNDVIHIRSDNRGPHFYGYVQSAADHFDIINEGGQPQFHAGYQLSAARRELPYSSEEARANAIHRWSGNECFGPEGNPLKLSITFKSNGQMICVRKHQDLPDGTPGEYLDSLYDDYPDTSYLTTPGHALMQPGSVWSDMLTEVSGKVDGEVTVACAKNIRIVDDLVYADSPMYGGEGLKGKPPQHCRNYLGIISEQNVMIANTPKNRHPQDSSLGDPWGIVINAGILALGSGGVINSGDWKTGGGSFSVEDMNTALASQALDGKYMLDYQQNRHLTLWGNVIQRYRGFVHRTNGFNTDGGFSIKDYHYDSRFKYHPPPDFARAEGDEGLLSDCGPKPLDP